MRAKSSNGRHMFLAKLISRLPLVILYAISDVLFFVAYYVVRYRRDMVQKNLRNSFPEKSIDDRKQIEREFYKNLCDYAVEMLKLLTISKHELEKRMVFKNPEIPLHYQQNGQSILILSSHQFNWEWLVAAACFNLPMPVDFVYQAVNNEFFESISLACRTRFGAYAIRRDQVAREVVKRKKIVRAIAMVADQYPGYDHDKKYSATFLHQETIFFYGSNQVAMLTQYPVLYYKISKIKRGYYETTPVEIANPPYPPNSNQVIDKYIHTVEAVIRTNPNGWLWSHNRWKTRHLKSQKQE